MEEQTTVEAETQKIARIGTDSFIAYLVGIKETPIGSLRGDIDDFEKAIEVPAEIHQAIKEMYELRREGLITGPTLEKRKSALAVEMNNISAGLGDSFMHLQPKVGHIEQARVVYIDVNNGELGSTSSTFGYGVEVSVFEPLQEAIAKNGLPIMSIHTHPEDANFSFADYSPLLMGSSTEGVRLMKAQVVLLPKMQLMVVVTRDTPIFTEGDDVNSLVSGRRDELDQQELQLARKSLAKLKAFSDRKRLADLVNMLREALGEEHKAMVDELAKRGGIQANESALLQAEIGKETKRAPDESARIINTAQVSFARELNLKLYFSQDMRTFKEFSG